MGGKILSCDVLVVGAGPAGLSAAYALAKKGANVICVEKRVKVGVPVKCAEGIGEYLFPYLPFKIPSRLLSWKIYGIDFYYDNLMIRRKGSLWSGYSIDRIEFENWLYVMARSAGVHIKTFTELTNIEIDENKEIKLAIIKELDSNKKIKIKPKRMIVAEGTDSKVAKLLGCFKSKKFDYMGVYSWEIKKLNLANAHFEQFFFGKFAPDSYCYIFPKSKKIANVGVGGFSNSKKLERYFNQFIESSSLKNQFKNAELVIEKSKKAPFIDVNKYAVGNVAFVGDSVNQNIKPFIEGFLPAIICGNLLGNIILDKNFSDVVYQNQINKTLPFISESYKMLPSLFKIFRLKPVKKYLLLAGVVSDVLNYQKVDSLINMSESELKEKILTNL